MTESTVYKEAYEKLAEAFKAWRKTGSPENWIKLTSTFADTQYYVKQIKKTS